MPEIRQRDPDDIIKTKGKRQGSISFQIDDMVWSKVREHRNEKEEVKVITICIAVVVFLMSLAIMLYPVISTAYNQWHQSQIHSRYQELFEQTDDTEKQKLREQTIAYNQSIQPGPSVWMPSVRKC